MAIGENPHRTAKVEKATKDLKAKFHQKYNYQKSNRLFNVQQMDIRDICPFSHEINVYQEVDGKNADKIIELRNQKKEISNEMSTFKLALKNSNLMNMVNSESNLEKFYKENENKFINGKDFLAGIMRRRSTSANRSFRSFSQKKISFDSNSPIKKL